MKNHTQLVLGINLKTGTSDSLIKILKYMTNEHNEIIMQKPDQLPSHPLFSSNDWCSFLIQPGFAPFGGCSINKMERVDYPDIYWELTIFNNGLVDIDLLYQFLDWLSPFIEGNGLIGYMRSEKNNDPTLIYRVNGKIEYIEISGHYDYLIRKQALENE